MIFTCNVLLSIKHMELFLLKVISWFMTNNQQKQSACHVNEKCWQKKRNPLIFYLYWNPYFQHLCSSHLKLNKIYGQELKFLPWVKNFKRWIGYFSYLTFNTNVENFIKLTKRTHFYNYCSISLAKFGVVNWWIQIVM
jgi:hypothetical protein